MRLSERVLGIGESATAKVWRRAAELRQRGASIVDFGAGEPDFASPQPAVEAARKALADGFTKYTALAGIPDLRQALAARFAARHRAPWNGASEVLITVGAKAALLEVALSLFESGDEVILPVPSWVSFTEQIRFTGAEPAPIATSEADGFRIHATPILRAMTDSTRGVILNSPTNPTGGLVEESDLRRIVEACAERGITVISDETYERFLYRQEPHASAAALAAEFPDTVVVVGSFSKTYAMTGWRVGYVMGPEAVIRAAAAIQSHATSNPTSFAMIGALAALQGAEHEVEIMVAEFRTRRDLMVEGLNALPGVTCHPPAGAFYAFANVSQCYAGRVRTSAQFAELLLEEAGVAVVPGSAFGSDRHVRLSFACSREAIAEGLERLRQFLS